jgi:uncharacterized protein (DUF1697 family)
MIKYVALLRGVNVGGRQIKMADLKVCFEAMGLTKVKTFLASGNVTFESDVQDSAKLRTLIETGVGDSFGYKAIIFVFPAEVIAKIVAADPFEKHGLAFHDYIVFIDNGSEGDLARLNFSDPEVERVQQGDGVLYWTVLKGMTLKSDLAKEMNRTVYRDHMTVRNANTLAKLIK